MLPPISFSRQNLLRTLWEQLQGKYTKNVFLKNSGAGRI